MNPSETNVDPSLSFGSGPRKRAYVGIARLFKLITIEPVVFLYGLGISISFVVSPALYMEKICTVSTIQYIQFYYKVKVELFKVFLISLCNNIAKNQ